MPARGCRPAVELPGHLDRSSQHLAAARLSPTGKLGVDTSTLAEADIYSTVRDGTTVDILAAAVIGIPADGGALFTPIALLWVNLIMDGPPALALGVDPPTPGSMHRPPRRSDAPILSIRRLLRLLGTGAVMAVGTLGVYVAVAGGFDAPDAETAARARTMAFTTFVLFQLFNIFNARSEHASAFTRQSFTNAKLWVSLAVVAALQVLVVVWPSLQQLMTGSDVTAVLGPLDWLLVVAVAALVLVPDEARKLAAGKHPTDGFRQGRDPSTD